MSKSEPALDEGREESAVEAIEDALTTLVRRVNLPRTHERLLRAAGIPMERAAYLLLRQIGEQAPVRLSDLAATLGIDVSTASRQVRALELSGLVERIADPCDGRAALLQPTEPGQADLLRHGAARRRAMETILGGWSDADKDQLAALLARLVCDVARLAEKAPDRAPILRPTRPGGTVSGTVETGRH